MAKPIPEGYQSVVPYLTVHDGDGHEVPIPEPKVRAVLADLLAHHGGPVTPDRLIADLKRVASTYLQPELASVAVVSHAGQRSALEQAGLAVRAL
jgi:hypothetical protein